MKVKVNNRDKILPEQTNITRLLEIVSCKDTASVAVAVNEQIIPKAQWQDRIIKEGDSIIIISAVCGG
jgi:thiamine biosynthesis protein ThiS